MTKRVVDAAKPGVERFTVWDSDLKGFGLRVSPHGTKTYVARYRVGGGRSGTLRQLVIGRHGAITADEARDEARARSWLRPLGAPTRKPTGRRSAPTSPFRNCATCIWSRAWR
ncbi:Arm DNA-binding domain-containing protein [Brevundimonas albigilva]|uniref:Arm DNA-binding domain-containing protein n=1 Tax=Brevundimonas albigilva TaxID=1312364 RepID=UPI003D313707